MTEKPRLKYMRDYTCTSLWTNNDEARKILGGYNVPYEKLPLSDILKAELEKMDEEYLTLIDFNDPHQCLWDSNHINDYNKRSDFLYERLVEEIGGTYDIINLEKVNE